jgi:hypothetical protein
MADSVPGRVRPPPADCRLYSRNHRRRPLCAVYIFAQSTPPPVVERGRCRCRRRRRGWARRARRRPGKVLFLHGSLPPKPRLLRRAAQAVSKQAVSPAAAPLRAMSRFRYISEPRCRQHRRLARRAVVPRLLCRPGPATSRSGVPDRLGGVDLQPEVVERPRREVPRPHQRPRRPRSDPLAAGGRGGAQDGGGLVPRLAEAGGVVVEPQPLDVKY